MGGSIFERGFEGSAKQNLLYCLSRRGLPLSLEIEFTLPLVIVSFVIVFIILISAGGILFA